MKRLHARVEGRVQGVGFRWYTMKHGRALGLSGWVLNNEDGSVELVAEGEESKLRELLVAIHRGPPASQVRSVFDQWSEAQGGLGSFDVG